MKELLKEQEGLRLTPYKCTAGKLTIGYGYNLEEGISENVANILFDESLAWVVQATSKLPWFKHLNEWRQGVVENMIFNMGLPRFMKFQRFIKYLEIGDFDKAANEMMDSLWAKQVGIRAEHLSMIMRQGKFIKLENRV